MATYIPDPTNVDEPLDTRPASTAAAEFRALKTFLQSVVAGGLPPVTGKNGYMLLADTSIPGAKWVDVKSTVLPGQSGNSGRLLSTDGTDALWSTFYSFLPSMAGKGSQLVRVNAAATAYEYAAFASLFPAGSPGYVLQLNAGGTAPEWSNTPALGAATAALAAATANTNQLATTAWVRSATFAQTANAGVDTLFSIAADTLAAKLQAIRDNLRYIKETQIPAVVAGNVASATKLATARTIGGVSFDGTANITLPGVNATGNQSTSGNAATATQLATARTINGVSFNGTANITVADATKLPLSGGTVTGNVVAQQASRGAVSLLSTGTPSRTGLLSFDGQNAVRQGYVGYSDSESAVQDFGTIPFVCGVLEASNAIGVGTNIIMRNAASAIYSSDDTGYNVFAGGAGSSGGANLLAYGGTHATQANIGYLRAAATNVFKWEAGAVTVTGTLSATGAASLTDASTVGGVSIGYRNVPRTSGTGKTMAVSDIGKCYATTGACTIPASVFDVGDALMIYNNSATAVTLTQGSGLTLRLSGTTNTGNRTIFARGIATIWFNSATEAIVSGAVS